MQDAATAKTNHTVDAIAVDSHDHDKIHMESC